MSITPRIRVTRRRRGHYSQGPSPLAVIAWCTACDPQLRSALTYVTVLGLCTRTRRFYRLDQRARIIVVGLAAILVIGLVARVVWIVITLFGHHLIGPSLE